MPKRYHVVRGSNSFTWQYIDHDERPPKLIGESYERWDTEEKVEAEIRDMGNPNREIVRGRQGPKPEKKNPESK
jgi:hypothetical protein